jgi:uncharacterized protein YicC (UPF0701 family)
MTMRQAMIGIGAATLMLVLTACEQAPPRGATTAPAGTQGTVERVQESARAAADTVKDAATEAAAKAGEMWQQAREKSGERIRAQITRTEAYVAELKAKAADAAAEARPELEAQVAKWRGRLELLRQMLGNVQAASGEAWEDMAAGVDGALDEFSQALDEEGTPVTETQPAKEKTGE